MFGSNGGRIDHIYEHFTEDITMKELRGRASVLSQFLNIRFYKTESLEKDAPR
jgi:thiamine pyrophosphokinase